MKNLTIAIDGHASTGKSSIAKELAVKYGYIYINSGSMYRAVTLFAIENNLLELTKTNINLFIDKLKEISINFKFNDNSLISEIYLNSRNIENEIGGMHVSKLVSENAAIQEIRKEMVKNGLEVSYEDILYNIKNRDLLDSTRSDSPLVIEKDAVVIDNSHMSINDQIVKISKLIEEKFPN